MQLTLAQGYSVTTMLAVAAAAILLTAGFYYRAFGTLRTSAVADAAVPCAWRPFCWW